MLKNTIKRLLAVAMLSSIVTVVFAEDAPVYELDNYPPQFDNQADAENSQEPIVTPLSPPSSSVQAISAPAPRSMPMTMEQRLAKAEQQINNLQNSNSFAKVDSLQNDVQTLRGQVEELTHQLQQAQAQQQAMFSDLDKRITKSPLPTTVAESTNPATQPATVTPTKTPIKVEKKPLPVVSAAKAATPPAVKIANVQQPNVAEEQQIYQTAYDLIKAKKYSEAIAALQRMLQKYPSGQFAANAHYWLGELYGLLNNNEQSAAEFATVVKDYPDSPKVSDAQLKLGLIYAGQFKWSTAKVAFKKVITHYPGTASARLASEQLKQIKQEGH